MAGMKQAGPGLDQLSSDRPERDGSSQEAGEMLDVRIPHVHAPHGEAGGWRGFVTHIAVVVIGLLLALGLEQGVEYVHHEFQRATLESQMRQTFQSNLNRAQRNMRLLDGSAAFLMELRDAINSRIAGGSKPAPSVFDPRNVTYVPPPNLGSFDAAKTNGSISLLGLNRVRLYGRIEFQHDLMLRSFYHFFDTLSEIRAFVFRFGGTDVRGKLAQVDLSQLSPAQLLEYQALIAKLLQYNRQYAQQLGSNSASYQMMLNGVDDVDTLVDAQYKQNRPPPLP